MAEKSTVLFVDDELHILNAIRRATDEEEFEAIFVLSGREALEVLEQREISVIVSDMRMPGMDGLTLLKTVREKYPKTVRIVLSGYTQLYQVLATVNQADIFQFIPKPWQMEEELLVAVRQAIGKYNLELERDVLRDNLEKKNQAYLNIFREMELWLENEKKDVSNLKRINQWLFSFWKKHLEMYDSLSEENRKNTPLYLNVMEELQLMYLDILPVKKEAKLIDNLAAELAKNCCERLVLNTIDASNTKLWLHYGFILMVIKMLANMASPDEKRQFVGDIRVKHENEEDYKLIFDFNLKFIDIPPLEQNKLKIACMYLSEMGKVYDIVIKPAITDGVVENIRITCDAKSTVIVENQN